MKNTIIIFMLISIFIACISSSSVNAIADKTIETKEIIVTSDQQSQNTESLSDNNINDHEYPPQITTDRLVISNQSSVNAIADKTIETKEIIVTSDQQSQNTESLSDNNINDHEYPPRIPDDPDHDSHAPPRIPTPLPVKPDIINGSR